MCDSHGGERSDRPCSGLRTGERTLGQFKNGGLSIVVAGGALPINKQQCQSAGFAAPGRAGSAQRACCGTLAPMEGKRTLDSVSRGEELIEPRDSGANFVGPIRRNVALQLATFVLLELGRAPSFIRIEQPLKPCALFARLRLVHYRLQFCVEHIVAGASSFTVVETQDGSARAGKGHSRWDRPQVRVAWRRVGIDSARSVGWTPKTGLKSGTGL